MSQTTSTTANPKSIRHKQILDVAAERPEANTVEIADSIPSVTPDLVERVLEEYGDPADVDDPVASDRASESDDTSEPTAEADDERERPAPDSDDGADQTPAADDAPTESTEGPVYPAVTDLSEKELETLRAIRARPDATQDEIGEMLGISRATVSNRVNAIDGFDWRRRSSFVDAVLGDGTDGPVGDGSVSALNAGSTREASVADGVGVAPNADGPNAAADGSPTADASFAPLVERIEAVERRLDEIEVGSSILRDPELASKVVHACMQSDVVSEDDELEILRELLD